MTSRTPLPTPRGPSSRSHCAVSPTGGSRALSGYRYEASISRAMTALISEQHYARGAPSNSCCRVFSVTAIWLASRVCQRQRSDARQSHRPVAAAEGYLQQGIFERADWEASLQGWSVFSRQCHNPGDNGRWQNWCAGDPERSGRKRGRGCRAPLGEMRRGCQQAEEQLKMLIVIRMNIAITSIAI